MEKSNLDLNDPSLPAGEQNNSENTRKSSIRRFIESLVHACRCKEASCRLASCQRMKRVIQHIKSCQRRTSAGCSVCRQLVALCCYHAKHCQQVECPVPFCFSIKQKLKQKEYDRSIRQANPIGSNPVTQTDRLTSKNMILQELAQTLRSPNTPDKRNRILNILESNPTLMAAFIKHRHESRNVSLARCLQSLLHACQCRSSCWLVNCQKMKRLVLHVNLCKRRASADGCSLCKRFVALCCHHASHCRENNCPVPFCFNIKQKLKVRSEADVM